MTFFTAILALFAALPASANHCPYQLVQFRAENETAVRLGFAASPEGEIVARVVDITDLLSESRASIFSTAMTSRFSEIQCSFNRDPALREPRLRTIWPQDVLPAIPQPKNIVAMGLNERAHAREVGRGEGDGFLFSKRMPVSGPYEAIVRPAFSLLDYEVELGVVIRREIRAGTVITADNIREYVAGFVLVNDVSNRTPILLALGGEHFTAAKTYPSFLPVGPYFAPIENFTPANATALLPALRMESLVLRAGEAGSGDLARAERRQFGTSDEREFFVGLAGAIQLALENRSVAAVDAQLVVQKLLLDDKLEAGDLLLMGTISGVALRLTANEVTEILGRGIVRSRGDSMSVFWPHYEQFFREPGFCGPHNFGGPYPLRCMENWMRMKSWIVASEYCTNERYLTPDEAIAVHIEGLGTQVNSVVSNMNDPATQAEDRLRNDAGAMRSLCAPFGLNWRNWSVAGLKTVGGIGGGAFLLARAARLVGCRSLLCRVPAIGAGMTPVAAGSLYSATDTLLNSRANTIAEIRASERYQILAAEVGPDTADEIEFGIQGGMTVRDAVMANVRSAAAIRNLYDRLHF